MTDESHLMRRLAEELSLNAGAVARTVVLFDEGATIPFVARYRKEVTGGLDEEQLRALSERLRYLRNLEERREQVLRSIGEQGKLTEELEAAIKAAETLQALEDLYLPYKPKRRTRATIARERGLEPLAQMILQQVRTGESLDALAAPFLKDDVPTAGDAWAGARDIVAEAVSEDAAVRGAIRERVRATGAVKAERAREDADPEGVYRLYYDFSAPFSGLAPHQVLAINRAEREGALKVALRADAERLIAEIEAQHYRPDPRSPLTEQLHAAIADGYERLLGPAIERELRRTATEAADTHAIELFAANLRQLLLQPPLRGATVIGIDPGYRTGCKVALVDPTGKVLDTTTIYPHEPRNAREQALQLLVRWLTERGADVIASGNGTASRETEALAADAVAQAGKGAYVIVSEAGASVYSASPLAREELPDLDVSLRGAVSIARRLQDPLAELVKIEPKAIGVGLYQHDVDQKALAEALDGVVESAVNYVGVDLNTASPALLRYVSGLTARTAKAIVACRETNGAFRGRSELRKVPGIGPKAFEQAAGFLRIPGGANPLDDTFIHPESYAACERLFALMGVRAGETGLVARVAAFRKGQDLRKLAAQLGIGAPTLADILDNLQKPGRDPREGLAGPLLRRDVLDINDLQEGMVLKGTVRNVVDFGAFVDIGVKRDGLVHVSQMADRYVRNPLEVVSVGQIVEVRVIGVDKERGRINLSMRKVQQPGSQKG
ncbi:MAG TPA: Tex family protein [Anaerolineae bacterium]|nr:Tex family protein [Anaerolineae bacterium]HOQ98259.1 Tex family protein [Anaerolineae bacterium]